MKSPFFAIILLSFVLCSYAQNPRLIILTDIGQDPDDEQSMVRLLHYANEFNIEGLIATADNNYEHEDAILREDIIYKFIDDYEICWSNFNVQAQGFPKADALRKLVKKGNFKGGTRIPVEKFIGKGFDTEGSDWIIKVVDKKNTQPICIAVWGGACDLAQALWKVKNTRSAKEVDEFVSKLRVYFIANQDASNQWIIDNFPNLWLVLSLHESGDTWLSSFRGMFWGGDMSNTSKTWIHKNIHGHTALADNYPDHAGTGGKGKNPNMAIKEGDTPSFLYFLPNGLNQPEHPSWGGWGGRFEEVKANFFRDADDTVYDVSVGKEITTARAGVFRWRTDFQNDFRTRVKWGTTSDYYAANHKPIIAVDGIKNTEPLELTVSAGEQLNIDAGKSSDPDGDVLRFTVEQYLEAGTTKQKIEAQTASDGTIVLSIPENTENTQAHLILKVSDTGSPSLCAYKRIILNIK